MTPSGIEPETFRFVAGHLNHCATAVPLLNGYWGYFTGYSGRDMKLTSSLRLAQRIRISGVISPLPLYALTVWTGTTLPVYIIIGRLILIIY